jgi:hypothetical protein
MADRATPLREEALAAETAASLAAALRAPRAISIRDETLSTI